MRELTIDELEFVSGGTTAGQVAAAATVIAGVAATVSVVAAVIPGGQAAAVVSGVIAGGATVVAGVAAFIDAAPVSPSFGGPMPEASGSGPVTALTHGVQGECDH